MICKYHAKMEKYIDRIETLRHQLWEMEEVAFRTKTPVPTSWEEVQKELLRILRNAKAYNKRHHLNYLVN